MCHCLYQVVTQRFQQSTMDSAWTVIGTVIFLRFINPAIGNSSFPVFLFFFHVRFSEVILDRTAQAAESPDFKPNGLKLSVCWNWFLLN